RIITGMSLPATKRSLWITEDTCASPVSRYCRVEKCGLRAGALTTAGAAVSAWASTAVPMGLAADQGAAPLSLARHQTVTPLCMISCLGVGMVPLKRSINDETGMPKSEEKVCALSAANGRPIWNCALRLAEM